MDRGNLCVSFHYSLVAAAAFWAAACSDGQHSDTSNGIPSAAGCSPTGLGIGFSTMHPSIVAMSESLFATGMQHNIAEWLTSYRRAFRARNFPSQTTPAQASALPELEIATNGLQRSKSFALWNPVTSSWRMLSDSSGPMVTSEPYLGTWPRRGMMCDGIVYPVLMSGQAMSDDESGLSADDDGEPSGPPSTCSNANVAV